MDVQTDDPQRAAKVAHGWATQNPKPEKTTKNELAGVAGNYLDGILPGSAGFVRGASEVVKNAIQAPFSAAVDFEPGKAYSRGQRFQEQRQKMAASDHPTASNAAGLAGIGAGLFLPATKIARGATLGQKALAGAKTAGAYGLASGAMSSKEEGIAGKATDAVSSGLLAATTGGALPYVTKTAGVLAKPLRPLTDPVVRAAGRGAKAVGQRLPGRAGQLLAAEGTQLARDPVRAVANQVMDRDLRGAVNPETGRFYTPQEVAAEVARRQQDLNVPAALADVHESARRSFGSAARSPGPATAAVRRAIDQRQQASTQRVTEHIQESLGPTANVEAQADRLKDYAREVSQPLYDVSDAQPIPFVKELQELMTRPSARDALQIAGRQLRDEGEDLTAYGLRELPGDVFEIANVPTMPMYDRVKSVLDETVYAGGKPLAQPDVTRASRGAATIRSRLLQIMDGDGTGPRYPQPGTDITVPNPTGEMMAQGGAPSPSQALGLPEAPPMPSRSLPASSESLPAPVGASGLPMVPTNPIAQTPTPRDFGQRLSPEIEGTAAPRRSPPSPGIPPEGLNPYWKPARDAYAGPTQARQAMELGEEMATSTGDDIANRLADLTGTQADFFRLGHRSGLAQDVQALGDWGNAAARVAGSAKKRQGLTAAHGDRASDLLDRTLAEHEAHQTWKAVRGNSATADRLAEMAEQDQAIETASKGVFQALAGRPGEGLLTAVRAIGSGGQAEAEAKGRIAEIMGSTDLEEIAAAIREMTRERARRSKVDRNAARSVQQGSRFLGSILGTNMIEPVED